MKYIDAVKNVFRGAKFGDKFLRRNGQVMIYQKQAREDVYCLFDEVSDCVIEYRPNGDVIYEYTGNAEPQEDDIVKKYVQPPLPSNMDEAANKFAVFYDQGTCDGIAQDCFKAGAEWMAGQLQQERAEVDLSEETIIKEFHAINDRCFNGGIEGWQKEKLIARHFYELGKNSK